MKANSRRMIGCSAASVVVLISLSAVAEPPRQRDTPSTSASAGDAGAEPLFYEFEDDALNALGYDAQGMVLRVRPGAARVLLLRPRVQFVTELLQSVEAL